MCTLPSIIVYYVHVKECHVYFSLCSLQGFEWNKYNQTHYDTDNPPPKIVQGYKFNVRFFCFIYTCTCTRAYVYGMYITLHSQRAGWYKIFVYTFATSFLEVNGVSLILF